MTTDTPRTDAFFWGWFAKGVTMVSAMAFARELEREINGMETRHAAVMLHTQSVVDENAELRAANTTGAERLAHELREKERLRVENDALRACVAREAAGRHRNWVEAKDWKLRAEAAEHENTRLRSATRCARGGGRRCRTPNKF